MLLILFLSLALNPFTTKLWKIKCVQLLHNQWYWESQRVKGDIWTSVHVLIEERGRFFFLPTMVQKLLKLVRNKKDNILKYSKNYSWPVLLKVFKWWVNWWFHPFTICHLWNLKCWMFSFLGADTCITVLQYINVSSSYLFGWIHVQGQIQL